VTDVIEKLSCQELVELVTDYLEDTLSQAERERFDAHVATCAGCRMYVEQMRSTLRVTGELTPASLSPEAEESLLEAFRAWRSA
jgi:anti-sigma factor RsiW